jgi:hypothetical protein
MKQQSTRRNNNITDGRKREKPSTKREAKNASNEKEAEVTAREECQLEREHRKQKEKQQRVAKTLQLHCAFVCLWQHAQPSKQPNNHIIKQSTKRASSQTEQTK